MAIWATRLPLRMLRAAIAMMSAGQEAQGWRWGWWRVKIERRKGRQGEA